MAVRKKACKCGFMFAFGKDINKQIEVVCPKCKTTAEINPAKTNKKGDDN